MYVYIYYTYIQMYKLYINICVCLSENIYIHFKYVGNLYVSRAILSPWMETCNNLNIISIKTYIYMYCMANVHKTL